MPRPAFLHALTPVLLVPLVPQIKELGKNACQPQGFYGPLSKDDVKVRTSSCEAPAGGTGCQRLLTCGRTEVQVQGYCRCLAVTAWTAATLASTAIINATRCMCVCICVVSPLQKLKKLIDEQYRINLVLDNLPVTAQDLLDEVRVCMLGGAPDKFQVCCVTARIGG